jgi:hypothetical protein
LAEHTDPQVIPFGLEVTVPVPVPVLATERVDVFSVNVAATFRAVVMLTMQAPVPVQAPVHPAKVEPVPAEAARVTLVPPEKLALHDVPHAIPPGVEVTVPLPVPFLVSASVYEVGALKVKAAVTLFAPSTTKAQLPVPVQAPLQPEKVDPVAAVALRARLVPLAMLVLQALPQSMPLGLDATAPIPVPVLPTVTVYRVALAGVAQAAFE